MNCYFGSEKTVKQKNFKEEIPMKALYTACAAIALTTVLSFSSVALAERPDHEQPQPTHQAPEPATILLVGAALSALGIAKRVKK